MPRLWVGARAPPRARSSVLLFFFFFCASVPCGSPFAASASSGDGRRHPTSSADTLSSQSSFLPSLPVPSLPFSSLLFPSLPFSSLLFPSLPFSSLLFPSLPFSSLPFPFPSLPFPSFLPFLWATCHIARADISDPDKDIAGWGENDRGVSFTFGEDIVAQFLRRHDLDLICRAHQVKTRHLERNIRRVVCQGMEWNDARADGVESNSTSLGRRVSGRSSSNRRVAPRSQRPHPVERASRIVESARTRRRARGRGARFPRRESAPSSISSLARRRIGSNRIEWKRGGRVVSRRVVKDRRTRLPIA